ncbi:Protein of unknown function (DUF664) [Prauserella sp. Am3]|nr:Protein of unknown function (DUF664) [Prauserella sp. Am3]
MTNTNPTKTNPTNTNPTNTAATTAVTTPPAASPSRRERDDLAGLLERQRSFLRYTTAGLDDDRATRRTTVSELTLAGLVKHVAATERAWIAFAGGDTAAVSPEGAERWADEFRMLPGETLAGLLEAYADTARATERFLATAELDATHPLPEAPWFEPGSRWSVRQVLLHIAVETAQHAGHADIIRESLDGQRTMG